MHVIDIDSVEMTSHDNNLTAILVSKALTGSYLVQIMKVLPGAKMPVHLHDHSQVYIVLDGSAKLRVGSETQEVKGGQVVFLPPNVEHETIKAGPDGMRYVVIE